MRKDAERTALILRRTQALRRRRRIRGNAVWSALCCALCASLVGLFRALTGDAGAGYVPGLYGSALLYGGAGGYVLAGVLSFALGVAVTVLCIRYKKKNGAAGREKKK